MPNITVGANLKQNEAIYKKKEIQSPTFLLAQAQWLEELDQSVTLTQLISAIYQLEFHCYLQL